MALSTINLNLNLQSFLSQIATHSRPKDIILFGGGMVNTLAMQLGLLAGSKNLDFNSHISNKISTLIILHAFQGVGVGGFKGWHRIDVCSVYSL
jgi:hypothetical protein